ncbi:hypothetical protein, conserved [Eimeria maxima]|uniref:Uncharacterized protein n=1 Tax=Eimeria maxima TaxID=5804 RepID=U6M0I5_EIMMA|nr:hypothetical protein, conserved [Eimeria maxima]CDJ56583.1 hypothetical protein, conserved [Eimeria maxima]
MKCRQAFLLSSILLFQPPTANTVRLAIQLKEVLSRGSALQNGDICWFAAGGDKKGRLRYPLGFASAAQAHAFVPCTIKEATPVKARAQTARAEDNATAATVEAPQATARVLPKRRRRVSKLPATEKGENTSVKGGDDTPLASPAYVQSATSLVGPPDATAVEDPTAATAAGADAVVSLAGAVPVAADSSVASTSPDAAPRGAVAVPSAGSRDSFSNFPITSLRTACRKLQLSSKGKRGELVQRLHEAASVDEIVSLIQPSEPPMQHHQVKEGMASRQEPEMPAGINAKPVSHRCHKCNRRLSSTINYSRLWCCSKRSLWIIVVLHSEARFCSACGATISTAGQETLREFVERDFWPVREQEVGSNTMRVERGFWQSILQVIGDVPVANLSSAIWEKYLGVLKQRNCSPRTQVLHQVAYLAALKYAVHTRRLDGIHPFRKIRGCTKRTLVSVPLTAEEVYLLLAATPNTMHCALFAVGIGAGLRPSEILSMRWEDINMEDMTATIRGSKTAASAAAIPLTNLAGRELMRWWEEEGKPTSGLCFYAEGIRTPSNRAKLEKKTPIRSFKKALLAAAQRAGIDELRCGERRRIFPYILRHSFATIAATSNPPVPLPVAQAVMRHTSSKMLLETYAKAGALVIKEGLRNFKV